MFSRRTVGALVERHVAVRVELHKTQMSASQSGIGLRCNRRKPTAMDIPSSKNSKDVEAHTRRRRKDFRSCRSMAAVIFLVTSVSAASAQSCISLSTSTQCPAFNASSVSTDPNLTSLLSVNQALQNLKLY